MCNEECCKTYTAAKTLFSKAFKVEWCEQSAHDDFLPCKSLDMELLHGSAT